MNSFKNRIGALLLISAAFITGASARINPDGPVTKIFVIGAVDKYHSPMVNKARALFEKICRENHADLHFTTDTSELTLSRLAKYDVLVQLHLAPYDMSPSQQFAVQQFIRKGKGWIGIHAAGLTGRQFEKDSSLYWKWFEHLMGDVVYSPHPPFQQAVVQVMDTLHPVTRNLPQRFSLGDEWYEYDRVPAFPAIILAAADESTYKPRNPMGYHLVIWTNPLYNRVLFISIGHDTAACNNPDFQLLVTNALNWALDQKGKEEKQMRDFMASDGTVLVNQVGYNDNLPKQAMFKTRFPFPGNARFSVVDARTLKTVFTGATGKSVHLANWDNNWYCPLDFSSLNQPGYYKIIVNAGGKDFKSFDFQIGPALLSENLLPAITGFFYGQKANSKEELSGDAHVKLFGSEKTVDLRGGWCDASGDVSKYFSHLAYTNFMNPQQTPMVDWSMIEAAETVPDLLTQAGALDSMVSEALYGADYIMKSLSPEGYFYMTLFSYFKKDPSERRVVGLLADSKTTTDYQCGYREGGGMAVAALARISRWQKGGQYNPGEYLAAAERAFEHLQKNSIKYIDDHTENLLDDYTALMAATELWITTGKPVYRDAARLRARRLEKRQSEEGFFWSNDAKTRPFWHAADAGLPVLSLARYLDAEADNGMRKNALQTIKKFIDYQLRVSEIEGNPFLYPRQTFRLHDTIRDGYFIPHENESGWWWQGENARIGSLATIMLKGGRLVYPADNPLGVREDIARFVCSSVNWILGTNPYQVCMMYGYGQVNVPYMAAMYGHGSGIGGISNGITGSKEKPDGSGIDFRYEDDGNEWRWSEQWIPHTAWFMQALAAFESVHDAKENTPVQISGR